MKGSLRRVFNNLPKRTIRPTSNKTALVKSSILLPMTSDSKTWVVRSKYSLTKRHKLRSSVCLFSISFKRNSIRERSQFKSSGKLRFIKDRNCVVAAKFVATSLLVKCVIAAGAITADVSGGFDKQR
uniref:Uncharacterized protein n=1 Tax=Glossina brevipalpis TaxID=37001 RepID=A0A1A9W7F3_9MUSC